MNRYEYEDIDPWDSVPSPIFREMHENLCRKRQSRPSPHDSDHLTFWTTPPSSCNQFAKKLKPTSPPTEKKDDFEMALLEYGRAVIKSAMINEPHDAPALEKQILTTRAKVLAEHEKPLKTSETELSSLRRQNRHLDEQVSAVKNDRSNAILELGDKLYEIDELRKEVGNE
jgi:hypothetical protein